MILEAMATGRPAVASAVGGIPELLDGEFTRMLFQRGDATELAKQLSSLRDWRTTDPGLADRCRDHVASRYPLAEIVTHLESIFTNARAANPEPTRRLTVQR